MIKGVRIFANEDNESLDMEKYITKLLISNGISIVDDNYDLAIAIGGDGSFLRMVRTTNFDSKPFYVGINSGTLGFLQESRKDEIDKLIDEIINEKYRVDEIGIQETNIHYDSKDIKFYSLNEIIVRDENLKVLRGDIFIENDLLESFNGDGILVATSVGSTAHNLSYGGSIVYTSFSTLQITPIAPINSSVYHTLTNPVIIPSDKKIIIKPQTKTNNVMVIIDGIKHEYNNVDSIITNIKDKKIRCLRFSHYNFPQKINEKLLS